MFLPLPPRQLALPSLPPLPIPMLIFPPLVLAIEATNLTTGYIFVGIDSDRGSVWDASNPRMEPQSLLLALHSKDLKMAPFIRWSRAKGSWDRKVRQARCKGICQCVLHSRAPAQVSAVAAARPLSQSEPTAEPILCLLTTALVRIWGKIESSLGSPDQIDSSICQSMNMLHPTVRGVGHPSGIRRYGSIEALPRKSQGVLGGSDGIPVSDPSLSTDSLRVPFIRLWERLSKNIFSPSFSTASWASSD
ncbi:hypothetical protein AMTR_s00062p00131160 [Amborella trichopoda]|uniref:Uncharacterized protein n=1 Tax=Amborella trichopoda TaxID=13333 RepID=U5D1X3_AMBTC|nr:hypothetical protein AMTR_s00062p00131160 [Amborella trichopoda]